MENGVNLKRESSLYNAVSMESLDNCSTISSGDLQSQVRTLFVSGLPFDVKQRELYLLFCTCQGYESSQLKTPSNKPSINGLKPNAPVGFKLANPVGFVTFATRQDADVALRKLQGIRFDPESSQTIRLEFARSNTKVTKPRQSVGSPTSIQKGTFLTPTLIPHAFSGMGNASETTSSQNILTLAAMQKVDNQHTIGPVVGSVLPSIGSGTAYDHFSASINSPIPLPNSNDMANQQLIGLQQLASTQQQIQQAQAIRQILVASAANQQQQQCQQTAILATYMAAQAQQAQAMLSNGNNSVFSSSMNSANGMTSTPCTTLFVANLGSQSDEDELRLLFRTMPGFCRLRMHSKASSSVAFIEFQTIEQASNAMQRLQGYSLSKGSQGSNKGIRIEYAKTKMGDGNSYSQQYSTSNAYVSGVVTSGITSAV